MSMKNKEHFKLAPYKRGDKSLYVQENEEDYYLRLSLVIDYDDVADIIKDKTEKLVRILNKYWDKED